MELPSGDQMALSASVEMVGQSSGIGGRAGGGVEVSEPDLLATVPGCWEENALVVGGELEAIVAGLRHG